MNMSDDVSGAVVGISSQVAQKGVETAQHVIDKTVDNIAKLLQAMFNKDKGGKINDKDVKSSDMTGLQSGEVSIKELVADAKKNGDSVVSTDGYSKADMKFIKHKAAEYGIPVAFTGKQGADNICAHVRDCDKPMFERICTEMMSDKMKVRPQELDNFKVERWEIDGIHKELSEHDLNANWGKTKDGEYFCLFEKADKKAVLMARDAFVKKCNEVEKDLTITKGMEYGMFTLKDEISGKEVSFNDIPSRSELSGMLQSQFGYDENKANIACCKFGENQLDGVLKKKFFADIPRNEFSDIQNHIELKGENILVTDYDCLRVTPKTDGVPRLVFRDENNNFAVLKPEKMTRKEMAEVIRDSLGIEDDKTVTALVDKAERVSDYYNKQNSDNFTLSHNEVIGEVEDDKSIEYSSTIERLDKDKFKVETTAQVREYEGLKVDDSPKKEDSTVTPAVLVLSDSSSSLPTGEARRTGALVLSFSDKRAALAELQTMYEGQGVPADAARQSAKEVFAKAQAQSPEKILHIEEVKVIKQSAEVHGATKNETRDIGAVMTVKYGNKSEEIDITEREKALTEIRDKFGVSEDEATVLFNKAYEKIDVHADLPEKSNTNDDKIAIDKPEHSELNGHEKKPAEPIDLNAKPDKPEVKTDIPKAPKARKK